MSIKPQCRIVEEPMDLLAEYGIIPIRFEVRSAFEVVGDDPATAELRENLCRFLGSKTTTR
jgi:hypothetical protein